MCFHSLLFYMSIRTAFYPISISDWAFLFLIKTKSLCDTFLRRSNIDPIRWKSSLKLATMLTVPSLVVICRFSNSAKIFKTIFNDWMSLPTVIKSFILDIGRVSGSISGREWNAVLDLKLKCTMLSITYLRWH